MADFMIPCPSTRPPRFTDVTMTVFRSVDWVRNQIEALEAEHGCDLDGFVERHGGWAKIDRNASEEFWTAMDWSCLLSILELSDRKATP